MTGYSDTWTQRALSQLCELRGRGWTFGLIATQLDCTRGAAVGRFFRLCDETAKWDRAKILSFDIMVSQGWTFEEISAEMRVSVEGLEARFAKHRLELGPQAV